MKKKKDPWNTPKSRREKEEYVLSCLVKAAFAQERLENARACLDLPDPVFSDAFLQKMDALLEKAQTEQQGAAAPAAPAAPTLRVAGRFKKGRMAAALAAAAVLLSTAVLAVSQGWWQRLLPTQQDGNLLLDAPAYSADAELSQDWPYFYLPTQLPEGYTEAQSTTTPAMIRIEYSTPEGATAPGIFFEQHRAITQMGIDTDDVVVTDVTIGDQKGELHQKNGMNSLYWTCDAYLFSLESELPAEELIVIAASLKKFC